MATTTNLGKVHVFPSEESYNTNKSSVGTNDLALVPIGVATTSEYGLVRFASESDVLTESEDATMNVPLAYELNDFRRIDKAYSVGDKVNCAFKFEYYLECTQAGTTSDESLDTRNVTFGQVIEDGTCQWTVRAHVKSVNGSVPDANGNVQVQVGLDAAGVKQIVLDTFFPIGSIYMDATGNINPNTQFGGTWVKIENRFLLGSSESKAVGTQGGEETHTLTSEEMPQHTHNLTGDGSFNITGQFAVKSGSRMPGFNDFSGALQPYNGSFGGDSNAYATMGGPKGVKLDAASGISGQIGLSGNGKAHNNMPPYEVVNVWKRTA